MAEAFLGLTMLVTLSTPPDAQLRGKVSSIVAGQSLTLRDVYCPANGQTIAEITIRASDIKDLTEAPKENIRPALPLPPQPVKKNFEDPAILSMGRRPIPTVSMPVAQPVTVIAPVLQETARSTSGSFVRPEPFAANSLAAAVDQLAVDVEEAGISDGDLLQPQAKKSRSRKRKARGASKVTIEADAESFVPEVTETNRAKGWRQTPLLEPNPSFQPFSTLKRKSKGKTYDNGWATEDATDVQEMGEFDFEMNLGKFDKKLVFDGIRAEDMTADEDRLVGHNRIVRPGTNGGKNLHPTENVLDTPSKVAWESEADDSEAFIEAVRGSQRDTGSGRTSRRGNSKLRKPPSRKESVINDQLQARPLPTLQTISKGNFYTTVGNKRCDVISALQMLNLENIADSEFGLSEDMMGENAGRGIAELVISVTSERGRTFGRKTSSKTPYVVVFAGNNKSGLRAVAAGRHLRNHGMNVVVCVLGLERELELLVGLRRQLKVFRSFGGKVLDKIELMDFIKSIDSPIDMIIDGLLGLTMAFEELRTGDQAAAYELIEWANRSEAEVMAIDVPTGIDPSSGKVSIIDGRPLYIRPAFVVAMGAPKKALLQAMNLGEGVGSSDAWRLWVADVGIASLAWKKAGTRMRRGVEFEKGWTFEITLRVSNAE